MGKYLSDKLGKDYTAIGFTFHSGQYGAKGENSLRAYGAQEPYLDIKKIKEDNYERLKWLIEELDFRIIGSLNKPDEFKFKNISEDFFDYLIFINQSTASALLK